jgi:hypothetical protein
MIPAMIVSLRYFLGWLVSVFRSREDLVLENLALRRQFCAGQLIDGEVVARAEPANKTRRIEFGRYAEQNRAQRGEGKPETFNFLGFTHISGKNRKGTYAVRRMTIGKRMRAKLQQIKQQLRKRIARTRGANRCMAQIGRAGILQLLRGSRKPRQPQRVPHAGGSVLALGTTSS